MILTGFQGKLGISDPFKQKPFFIANNFIFIYICPMMSPVMSTYITSLRYFINYFTDLIMTSRKICQKVLYL